MELFDKNYAGQGDHHNAALSRTPPTTSETLPGTRPGCVLGLRDAGVGVHLIVGCFALLMGWYGDNRGSLQGYTLNDLAAYVDDCLVALARAGVTGDHPLARTLQRFVAEIEGLQEGTVVIGRLQE